MAVGQLEEWTEVYFVEEDKSAKDATKGKAPVASDHAG